MTRFRNNKEATGGAASLSRARQSLSPPALKPRTENAAGEHAMRAYTPMGSVDTKDGLFSFRGFHTSSLVRTFLLQNQSWMNSKNVWEVI